MTFYVILRWTMRHLGIWLGVISWSALFRSRPRESAEAHNTGAHGLFDDALSHWAAHFEASPLKFKRRDFTFYKLTKQKGEGHSKLADCNQKKRWAGEEDGSTWEDDEQERWSEEKNKTLALNTRNTWRGQSATINAALFLILCSFFLLSYDEQLLILFH